jgi:outer membrane receptor protein involved in Fe transport
MNAHSKHPGLFCSAAPTILVVAAALIGAAPGSALAQSKPSDNSGQSVNAAAGDNSGQSVNEAASTMAEVLVTARKRSETLLEVPLAITAMSSVTMEKRGVDSLLGVADYTPSLNITNFGNSTTNRGSQTVIIRGMVPGTTYNQTTTVFINGAPLAASGIIDGISDVAQVEIIKGPQSAYFGRSTFGGAVNIITKAPGDKFKVSLDGTYGSYNWTDLKASVEGAIIPGKLAARLTGRYYQTDGYYGSPLSPGYKYGAQESKNPNRGSDDPRVRRLRQAGRRLPVFRQVPPLDLQLQSHSGKQHHLRHLAADVSEQPESRPHTGFVPRRPRVAGQRRQIQEPRPGPRRCEDRDQGRHLEHHLRPAEHGTDLEFGYGGQ